MNLGTLQVFLDSLQSYSQDLVQHLSGGLKLCHYTTLDGALGIIEGGDLWLSHLRFSNDNEEQRYGQRLVNAEVESLRRNPVAGVSASLLAAVQARLAAAQEQPIYICCFCEVDNLLSQWRGYAENGGGVSIEFDPEGMRAVSGPDVATGLSRLWRVFYDPAQQRKIVNQCILYPYWNAASDEERVTHIVEAIQFFIPTFKNQDFRGEQERRLVFTPGDGAAALPRYRVRSGMVVPFVRLRDVAPALGARVPPLPIRAITVGPGRFRDLNRESLQMAVDQRGYAGVEVKVSTTPYRS